MQVSLNGKPHTFDNISTLEHIIQQFCKNNKHIIAELNGAIITSKLWSQTPIKNGDIIELVSIVGGG